MAGTRFQGSWNGVTNEDKITGSRCSMRTHFTNQNRLRDWPLASPSINLPKLRFLLQLLLLVSLLINDPSSHRPKISQLSRWGYVIALIRDVCHLSSPLFSVEGEETVVRASFNQRRLISISEQPSISPLGAPRLLFFSPPSIVVDRCLSFFPSSFLFFAFVSSRARARQTFSAVWNGA